MKRHGLVLHEIVFIYQEKVDIDHIHYRFSLFVNKLNCLYHANFSNRMLFLTMYALVHMANFTLSMLSILLHN